MKFSCLIVCVVNTADVIYDSLVRIQEDDPDSLHSDLGVHGEDVDVLLRHPQFALHQIACNLMRRRSWEWTKPALNNLRYSRGSPQREFTPTRGLEILFTKINLGKFPSMIMIKLFWAAIHFGTHAESLTYQMKSVSLIPRKHTLYCDKSDPFHRKTPNIFSLLTYIISSLQNIQVRWTRD